jgi:hypothetical protein
LRDSNIRLHNGAQYEGVFSGLANALVGVGARVFFLEAKLGAYGFVVRADGQRWEVKGWGGDGGGGGLVRGLGGLFGSFGLSGLSSMAEDDKACLTTHPACYCSTR